MICKICDQKICNVYSYDCEICNSYTYDFISDRIILNGYGFIYYISAKYGVFFEITEVGYFNKISKRIEIDNFTPNLAKKYYNALKTKSFLTFI